MKFLPILGLALMLSACGGEQSAFEEAKRINHKGGYDKFLAEYPESDYAIEAKRLREKSIRIEAENTYEAIKQIKDVNEKIAALEKFVQDYPNFKTIGRVRNYLKSLKGIALITELDTVVKSDSIGNIEKFLEKHKASFESGDLLAMDTRQKALYRIGQLTPNTISALEAYIAKYPSSGYVYTAKNQIDKLKFEGLNLENGLYAILNNGKTVQIPRVNRERRFVSCTGKEPSFGSSTYGAYNVDPISIPSSEIARLILIWEERDIRSLSLHEATLGPNKEGCRSDDYLKIKTRSIKDGMKSYSLSDKNKAPRVYVAYMKKNLWFYKLH